MTASPDLIDRSLDALDDVFYVYDADATLVRWNRRLEELFDLSGDDLGGMTPAEFFVESDRPAVEAAVEGIERTGETVVEARAETTEGVIRFHLSGQLLINDGGVPLGFAGVVRALAEAHGWTVTLRADVEGARFEFREATGPRAEDLPTVAPGREG